MYQSNSTKTSAKSERIHLQNEASLMRIGEFSVKVANTLEEREQVFQLAYRTYLDKGYIPINKTYQLIQDYDFYKSTAILIVKNNHNKIVGSLTLIFSEDGQLPLEKIYHEEVKEIKSQNKKILEVGRLAIEPEYRNENAILNLLLNMMLIYSHYIKKYDSMIIQVNPRHKQFYKALLKFDEIGGEKQCPSVQNAPAVLLHLPIERYLNELKTCNSTNINPRDRSLYPYFLLPRQEPIVAKTLHSQFKSMNPQEKSYFQFISHK